MSCYTGVMFGFALVVVLVLPSLLKSTSLVWLPVLMNFVFSWQCLLPAWQLTMSGVFLSAVSLSDLLISICTLPGGTAAAAPPPFRPSDPALCGSRP